MPRKALATTLAALRFARAGDWRMRGTRPAALRGTSALTKRATPISAGARGRQQEAGRVRAPCSIDERVRVCPNRSAIAF
jgi:hypothetical protein